MQCFWCYKPLPNKKDRTKDHFLSRPLWNHAHHQELQNRGHSCTSCEDCNSRRGTISSLYLELHRMKRKFSGRKLKTWLKCKKRLMPLLQHFRKKIEASVENETVKTLCLQEIDEILEFIPLEQEVIQVHAYYLWEKAGRPNGQDEKFWLEAENEICCK